MVKIAQNNRITCVQTPVPPEIFLTFATFGSVRNLLAIITAQMASGKSVRLWSCRLGFDSESGQTNDLKTAIHSLPA